MVYFCRLIPEEGGYVVDFSDVKGAITEGDSIEHALAIVNADFNLPVFADEILPLSCHQSKPTAPTRSLSFIRYESPFKLNT